MSADSFRRTKPTPEPVPTGRFRFRDTCPFCDGRGTFTPCRTLPGWYLEYHYQDGHEMSQPMPKDEAVRQYLRGCGDNALSASNVTLIGDDGQIYTLEGT